LLSAIVVLMITYERTLFYIQLPLKPVHETISSSLPFFMILIITLCCYIYCRCTFISGWFHFHFVLSLIRL
jgi:hypothetical protein